MGRGHAAVARRATSRRMQPTRGLREGHAPQDTVGGSIRRCSRHSITCTHSSVACRAVWAARRSDGACVAGGGDVRVCVHVRVWCACCVSCACVYVRACGCACSCGCACECVCCANSPLGLPVGLAEGLRHGVNEPEPRGGITGNAQHTLCVPVLLVVLACNPRG